MSDNLPTESEESNNECCGAIVGVCVWLIGSSLALMFFVQPLGFLFVVCLVVGGFLLLCLLLWLLSTIFGGRSKDRRYEELMEGYQEQDWMKDR